MIIHNKITILFAAFISFFLIVSPASADIFSGLEKEVDLQGSKPVSTLVPMEVGNMADKQIEKSQIQFKEGVSGETLPEVLGENTENIENDQILSEQPSQLEEVEQYTVQDPVNAVELKRLFLDADTITKGYTVTSPEEDFKAGVVDGAVSVPVTVVLKQIPGWHIPVDKTKEKVSYIFDVDIRACKGDTNDCGFAETTSLGVLEKPIFIALKFDSNNYRKKIIHFWNKPEQRWIPIDTTTDFDNNLARAKLNLPYARLAVFEDPYIQEGLSSWYHQFDGHYAASQVYKRGTMLKVTNISGGSRDGNFEIVKVNDYGPDPDIHPDRPIDLDSYVYKHLAASLGSGLMLVRVEPLEKDPSIKYAWILEAEKKEKVKKLAEKN